MYMYMYMYMYMRINCAMLQPFSQVYTNKSSVDLTAWIRCNRGWSTVRNVHF